MLTLQLTAATDGNASSSVLIDSVVFVPDYKLSTAYTDAGTSEHVVCFLFNEQQKVPLSLTSPIWSLVSSLNNCDNLTSTCS